ncbi:MAG: efflux RND transporter periplasmic adaptor subunit [Pseudomonadota bacterium]
MSILRQLVFSLAIITVAGAGYVGWTRYAPQATPADFRPPAIAVTVATVVSEPLSQRIEAVGTTRARQAIEVVAVASGRIQVINFEPGTVIEAGAVLVELDDDLERADLDEARALLRETELGLARARTLRSSAAVTQARIDELEAQQASGQARVERAVRRLADRQVRAPFTGIVGLRRADVGARVDDETVITTLDDLAAVEIAFQVPERFYGQVRLGQAVRASSAAFPERRFDGRIATLDSRIDRTTRSFAVRALLPNPDFVLPAGMFMHLEVVLATRTVVVVPESAVVVAGDEVFVFTVDDGRAVRRDVTLGQREIGIVEVVRGLASGDVVVVRGASRLADGVPVAPQPPTLDEPAVVSGSLTAGWVG